MNVIKIVYVGILGLIAGSFLTVVVHRLPSGGSIVAPRSFCPTCHAPIRPIDNVPVLSYLLRRGRCRNCQTRIPPRYLALELVTGALFAAVAARVASPWEIPAYCVLAASLVALSAIDLMYMRLPSKIIYTTGAIGAVLLVVASAGTHEWGALLRALIAGAASFGVVLVIHLVVPRGMGFGDVRLAGLCGGFLGWLGYRFDVTGIWLGFIVGGSFALALVAVGKASRGSHMPFGPFLAFGTMVAVFLGPEIAHLQLP